MSTYEDNIPTLKDNKAADKAQEKHMPGDEMIWLFLLGDMACFSLFFCMFAYYRLDEIELFRQSQAQLDVNIGSINTLFLLCSSWLVVMALKAARKGLAKYASFSMAGAALFGTGFVILKTIEYQHKAALDIDYLSNNFYVFYYILTGMHYFHVVIGVPLLIYYAVSLYRSKNISQTDVDNLESGALYWHMVDLLWIIIFPLVYLIP